MPELPCHDKSLQLKLPQVSITIFIELHILFHIRNTKDDNMSHVVSFLLVLILNVLVFQELPNCQSTMSMLSTSRKLFYTNLNDPGSVGPLEIVVLPISSFFPPLQIASISCKCV